MSIRNHRIIVNCIRQHESSTSKDITHSKCIYICISTLRMMYFLCERKLLRQIMERNQKTYKERWRKRRKRKRGRRNMRSMKTTYKWASVYEEMCDRIEKMIRVDRLVPWAISRRAKRRRLTTVGRLQKIAIEASDDREDVFGLCICFSKIEIAGEKAGVANIVAFVSSLGSRCVQKKIVSEGIWWKGIRGIGERFLLLGVPFCSCEIYEDAIVAVAAAVRQIVRNILGFLFVCCLLYVRAYIHWLICTGLSETLAGVFAHKSMNCFDVIVGFHVTRVSGNRSSWKNSDRNRGTWRKYKHFYSFIHLWMDLHHEW